MALKTGDLAPDFSLRNFFLNGFCLDIKRSHNVRSRKKSPGIYFTG